MQRFVQLSKEDRTQLLKYPAYVSLLASTVRGGLDDKEMKTALRLTHVKTFAGDPIVADFYREVEKNFEETIATLNKELPQDKISRTVAITHELKKLDVILKKVSPYYADAFHHSMRMYKDQVARAHHNFWEYFVLPMPIKGISD